MSKSKTYKDSSLFLKEMLDSRLNYDLEVCSCYESTRRRTRPVLKGSLKTSVAANPDKDEVFNESQLNKNKERIFRRPALGQKWLVRNLQIHSWK